MLPNTVQDRLSEQITYSNPALTFTETIGGVMRLNDKVALISGGSRGQGEAEARLFSKEGASVVIGDILEDEGKKVAAEINDAGGRALFVKLDVSSESEWEHAIGETILKFGKLNILVNNAAITLTASLEDTTVEQWDAIMAVNARGVFLGTKHAMPRMREAGGGSIINISSTAAIKGNPRVAAYATSKGGVRLLTKSTALQGAVDNIRANSIYPGSIYTGMSAETLNTPEGLNRALALTPLGRIGSVEDVAYGALYLASDESSFVTGSELVIDGGRSA